MAMTPVAPASSLHELRQSLGDPESSIVLSNGDAELLIPTQFGPRILGYSLSGDRNVLGVVSAAEQAVETSFSEPWHIYGGHRLWYAPEHSTTTYHPDNQPVRVVKEGSTVVLTQTPETHTGLEKSIEVTLGPSGSQVRLVHRLAHQGQQPLELAPWSLTVMARGGEVWIPHSPFVPHPAALAPARPLVLWPFTQMNDSRWSWGAQFVRLRQSEHLESHQKEAQKIGLYNELGWMAYQLGALLFIKKHATLPGAHADFGCNAEVFTNRLILEVESLGPMVVLQPGQVVEHEEQWLLVREQLSSDEDEAVAQLTGLVQRNFGS